jgi:hypothetical protein
MKSAIQASHADLPTEAAGTSWQAPGLLAAPLHLLIAPARYNGQIPVPLAGYRSV